MATVADNVGVLVSVDVDVGDVGFGIIVTSATVRTTAPTPTKTDNWDWDWHCVCDALSRRSLWPLRPSWPHHSVSFFTLISWEALCPSVSFSARQGKIIIHCVAAIFPSQNALAFFVEDQLASFWGNNPPELAVIQLHVNEGWRGDSVDNLVAPQRSMVGEIPWDVVRCLVVVSGERFRARRPPVRRI